MFLAKLICASTYDIFVFARGSDPLFPDSRFYTVTGKYVSFLINGYDNGSLISDMAPVDKYGRDIFFNAMSDGRLQKWRIYSADCQFFYLTGLVYFLFGDFSIWIRVLNIVLSIASAYLLFAIAKKHFGILAANLFLIMALFLPTLFFYSMMISKDVLRLFIVCVILWGIYG